MEIKHFLTFSKKVSLVRYGVRNTTHGNVDRMCIRGSSARLRLLTKMCYINPLLLLLLLLCTSLLYFVVRVRCCRKESSLSLSHFLMSFLFTFIIIIIMLCAL